MLYNMYINCEYILIYTIDVINVYNFMKYELNKYYY